MRRLNFDLRSQVRSLSELVATAQAYALAELRTAGSVRATLLVSTSRGMIAHCPERLTNEAEKEQFALECRLITMATEATLCALVLESWITLTPTGEIPNLPPSQHPQRREVVTIFAESRSEERFLILPIRRTILGDFEGLGENEAPAGLTTNGRFARMLSPQSPTRRQVEEAQLALEAMGVRCRREPGFSAN